MELNLYKTYLQWLAPMGERKVAPGWWFPGYLGICILSCLPPPRMKLVRIGLFGPILLLWLLYTPNYTVGDSGGDFAAGVFMAAVSVKWVDFVVCRVPEKEFWRVPEGPDNPSPKASSSALASVPPTPNGSFWEKVRWSISLWCTDRGIGWNWKVKNLQDGVPAGYSRIQFVKHCIRRTLVAYLAIDTTLSILKATPYANAAAFTDPKIPTPDIYKEELVTRTIVVWLVAIESYHSLHMPYYALAAITTALGICRPEQWPPLFGSYRREAWSVRNMWGKVWHQEIRKTISAPTDYVVRLLHVPRGTLWSRYSQLLFGFFFSSICHHGGAFLVHRNSAGMYTMWMSQACIIMLEDLVIYLGKKLGIRKNGYTQALGTLWSFAWFSLPWSCVTAANLVLAVGHAAFDKPPAGSIVSAFRLCDGCDALWQVLLDRSVVFFVLVRALNVLEVKDWNELVASGPSIAGALALYASSAKRDNRWDVGAKYAGAMLSLLDVSLKGM